MSVIDRTTPDDELSLLFKDNVGWSNPFDRAKALNFQEVCRQLLYRAPVSIELDGVTVQSRPETIRDMMQEVDVALGSTDATGSNVRYADFQGFRR